MKIYTKEFVIIENFVCNNTLVSINPPILLPISFSDEENLFIARYKDFKLFSSGSTKEELVFNVERDIIRIWQDNVLDSSSKEINTIKEAFMSIATCNSIW